MQASRWKKLAVVAAGTFAALLVAEAGLRVIGFSHPPLYRVDEHRGWVLAAGERGWYTAEGRSFVAVSSAGLREEEQPRDKPTGELRVAVLGDSMTEALQVPRHDTFVEVAERRLAACPDLPPGTRSVEVLNFGVSGYGTAQELLTLRHAALAWQPDAVVLAFYTGNDVRNNDREMEGDGRRPYFVLDADGEPVLDDSFRRHAGYRLRSSPLAAAAYSAARHVRLLQLAAALWSRLRQGPSGPPPGELHPGEDDAVYVPPEALADAAQGAVWERAWRLSEALVRRTAVESRAAGARFLLLSLSTGAQTHPDLALRRRFAAELGVDDLLYPERRLAALARREGIDYLALAPRLARRGEHGGEQLHGAGGLGHWNVAGQRAAGELLARRLCSILTAPAARNGNAGGARRPAAATAAAAALASAGGS
jgi:lysophospholipase L1-like esterase